MIRRVMVSTRTPDSISISAIAITKLMVKKPTRYPVRATFVADDSKIPVSFCLGIAASGNAPHSLILPVLLDVTPVVWRLSFAVPKAVSLRR